MDYELILKHSIQSPMGVIIPFENMLKINAELKGISHKEELEEFEKYKDDRNDIKDVKFMNDHYEEVK